MLQIISGSHNQQLWLILQEGQIELAFPYKSHMTEFLLKIDKSFKAKNNHTKYFVLFCYCF